MAIVALTSGPQKLRPRFLTSEQPGRAWNRVQCPRVTAARSSRVSDGRTFSADEAWEWLVNYTKLDFQGRAQHLRDNKPQRHIMRTALQTALAAPNTEAGWSPDSPEVLFGVVASDVRLGVRALRDWSKQFDAEYVVPEVRVAGCTNVTQVAGAVFIKFNLQSKVCYLSQYQGQDRGVLITLGTQQFGHFPLGLFDEDMDQPAPSLAASS